MICGQLENTVLWKKETVFVCTSVRLMPRGQTERYMKQVSRWTKLVKLGWCLLFFFCWKVKKMSMYVTTGNRGYGFFYKLQKGRNLKSCSSLYNIMKTKE